MTQLETPTQTPKASRSQKMQELARKRAKIDEEIKRAAEEAAYSVSEDEAEEEAVEEHEHSNASFLHNYRRQGQTMNYTSMIGGSYTVPAEQRRSFLTQYYNEFIQWLARIPITKPRLFLTERYNEEYFRFFIDVDYSWEDTPPDVLDTLSRVKQAVSRMLTYVNGGAEYEFEIRSSERTSYKRHFVFPQIIMSSTNALLFAQAVEKMVRLHGLDIAFDQKVYQKGSLRLLGSCKKTGLVSSHVKETEFFYMPLDPVTGERCTSITFDEFERHSILLDKVTHDRVQAFAASEDGVVFLPHDDQFADDLFATFKYLHSGEPNQGTGSNQGSNSDYPAPTYTGADSVTQGSPLYNFLEERFGVEVASNAGRITHDQQSNAIFIALDRQSTYCTLARRNHTSNHAYLILGRNGLRPMCYSTNEQACRNGGDAIPLDELPREVAQMLPESAVVNIQANADITTIRGQAELLQPDFIADDLLTDQDSQNLMILSLSGTHWDVANLLKPVLSDEFVCVDTDAQRWYHFRHPLWRYPEAKNDVKLLIGKLPHMYTEYIQTYYKNFTGKDKIRKQRIDTITRVKNKVSDHQFKDKVAKELASMSLDVRFEQMLDENRSLIGFNNGVFDLEKREFRAGQASDMVSMTTGYDFPTESNPEYREKLEKLLSDMQPDEANLKYLKKNLASGLASGNTFELFHIWAGTTRNGKSVLATLLSIALGSTGYKKENGELSKYPYACPFEPSFLTCDRSNSSSAPAPEVVAARLARVLIGSEPERGQKINSAFMKKLTGNDLLSARLLFSNDIVRFVPRFVLILICNDIPVMDVNEMAVWKRSRVVDFPVTFVDNPQEPNERQIDELLKDKLIEDMNWRKEFMLLLIEWYYDLYLVEGMRNPPASVLKATRVYQEKSVLIGEYWSTCITAGPKHLCLDCILKDFRARQEKFGSTEEGKAAYDYTQTRLKTDLSETLGVKVPPGQTRCANCTKKKLGVKNVRFSDARLAEKEEVEEVTEEPEEPVNII